ncbi:hypothetical protein SAMN06265371_108218 [Lutibacter agarilyticus]|uniref:Uncharacterized protein n=1 Tax=Lutibacter agarilyticus TaxID=1109740 RepID=A0A238YEA9_9FLAO|nr:hypothetical protein [Lutibacter agarilyticus]SNR68689.1 hypothetical protein SAMN06265371_108218 [Lutibacter agarilyticus]
MDIPITFLDFKTEENYLALQNKYAGWCDRNPPNEVAYLNVVKTDFSINYKTKNLLTDKEDYIEWYFIKDFLNVKIPLFAKRYIVFFKKHIESELLLEKERIIAYSKIQLKKIIEIEEIIKKSEYLGVNIKLSLLVQIEVVIDYLKSIHILPSYTIEEKFKMNMNKTDIILLLTLLRQNNNIDSIKDSHFGFLIEKTFLYKSGEDYTPIKNAGKVVNDVKHFNKGSEKAIERLKNIFKNDNFYELDFH